MSRSAGAGPASGRCGAASGTSTSDASMSSGSATHHRPGPARRGHRERAGDELRHALGAIDLRHPLGHRAEDGAVVELLEGLAPDRLAGDLPDEQEQRRRVLHRGVDAVGGVGGPRPAGDHAHARAAGELAVGLGHVRRAALVAGDDEPQRRVVQRVEDGEVALAGDAEGQVGPVQHELVDQDLPAAARQRTHRLLEEDRRALGLGLVGVGGIDVVDRALAGPLHGQQHDAYEGRGLVGRRRGQHRVGPALEPRLARAQGVLGAQRVDRDRAEEQVADARARMGVAVGDAARLEVDAVAAHEPLGRVVELDLGARAARPRGASSPSSHTSARPSSSSCTTRLGPAGVGAAGVLGE